MRKARLYVDGEWIEPAGGAYTKKLNPTTGEEYGEFASGTKEDAARAVDCALEAQRKWEVTPSTERARILLAAANLIRSSREELENILVEEVGKPAVEARQEVDGVLDQLTYYAEFARKITGDIVEGTRYGRWIHQYKVPYGVVVAITPWNFPAAMNARKIAPALLTGNAVVLKPSSDTPFSAEWMVRMFERAGIPHGVLNLVTGRGSEIGDALTSNRKVSLVTLTGETSTGKEIMKSASSNMAKLILELGGKAPFIVWKDADLELAARSLMWAKFWNSGQSCIAAERLLVHDEVYEKFMTRFLDLVKLLRVGDPKRNEMGPLINERQRQKVEEMVLKGEEEGMKPLYGANRPELPPPLSGGFHYIPTVLEGEAAEGTLFREEIFGPVLPAARVTEDFGELLDSLNRSSYGLASYLYTRDLSLALRASSELRFGELYVNMTGPEASQGYHTGFRLSGQAGEGSKYGIEEYVKTKNVYLDYTGNPLKGEVVPPYGASP